MSCPTRRFGRRRRITESACQFRTPATGASCRRRSSSLPDPDGDPGRPSPANLVATPAGAGRSAWTVARRRRVPPPHDGTAGRTVRDRSRRPRNPGRGKYSRAYLLQSRRGGGPLPAPGPGGRAESGPGLTRRSPPPSPARRPSPRPAASATPRRPGRGRRRRRRPAGPPGRRLRRFLRHAAGRGRRRAYGRRAGRRHVRPLSWAICLDPPGGGHGCFAGIVCRL